jgi:hypothetical protein
MPVRVVALTPLEREVNQAIDRGTAYLRKHGEQLRLPQRYEGLLGLTLLECGVPPNDPLVARIADSLRIQADRLDRTYELSIAIFFLDRLGKGDGGLIRLFADRLAAGQDEGGTWTYRCPLMDSLTGSPLTPTSRGPRAGGRPGRVPLGRGDHSNTQFATLALWVARRHGTGPAVEDALRRVDAHFRRVQGADGSWTYHPRGGSWRTSNTCAGLLALAVGHGVGRLSGFGGPGLSDDPAVRAALAYLGKNLSGGPPSPGSPRIAALDAHGDLYALWSVERVGALFGLKRIGDCEWYPWAARWLVKVQRPDGDWQHGFGPLVDTCFALLILRRTNLAPDLTKALGAPELRPIPRQGVPTSPRPGLREGTAKSPYRPPLRPSGDPRRGLREGASPNPELRRGLEESKTPAQPPQRRLP